MTELTRDERVNRQQRDDGDPDDDVFVIGTHPGCYHEDEDCPYLSEESRPVARERAQARWLAPCTYCVLEEGST